MRVTCATIASQLELDKDRSIIAELRELGDYDRRLIEAWLRQTNRNNARYLPPKALETFLPECL